MAALGLSSGLSRGFQAYGWPPLDAVGGAPLASTNREGWVANGARRPGQATVADAMSWVRQHRAEPIFLWIHLAEATPPYATDRDLAALYPGSTYDASMAYEDRCIKTLVDGFTSLGLQDRTTFVVAGNHGESLGDHGESFHGLNLYPPSLATAVAVIRPAGAKVSPAPRPASPGAQPAPARLQDLYAAILSIAGVEVPAGSGAKPGMPAVSAAEPLLAVTAGPRSSFGWSGRVALYDGGHAWFGPQDEEYYGVGPGLALSGDPAANDPAGARLLREKALALAAPIASRLTGRPAVPAAETRARLLELLRQAGAARERQDAAAERAAIGQAWLLDPGNFEVAKWLVQANGPAGKETNPGIVSVVADRGTGMPEADLALAQILQEAQGLGDPLEARARACSRGGAGCAVELALVRARASEIEPAAAALAPVAEQGKDADLWRTLGDLYLAAQDTYRASQAFEKAAGLRPDDPDILLRQGDCLAATRDYKAAAAKYEAAGAAQPGLALVELRLGRLSLQMRDRAAALEHFRKGVGVDTNTAAGAVALGRLLSDEGMTQEAIPLFLDAASRDTSSVEPLYYAAEALAAEGNLEEAEKQMRRALDRDPEERARALPAGAARGLPRAARGGGPAPGAARAGGASGARRGGAEGPALRQRRPRAAARQGAPGAVRGGQEGDARRRRAHSRGRPGRSPRDASRAEAVTTRRSRR